MKKLKELLKEIFHYNIETKESIKNDIIIKCTVSLVLTIAALVLTIFNITSKYYDMMWTTIALALSFGTCAVLFGVFKVRKVTELIISATIMAIFSYYAIAAQNQGFAILWIALVPALSMLLLSFRIGFIPSVYFLILLIVVFYTPLKDVLEKNIPDWVYYNETFRIRFPLLYASGFVVSLFLTSQKQFYLNKASRNALYDALTDLGNRRFYNDYVDSLSKQPINKNLAVVSVDINILKSINDTYGHNYGDKAIIASGQVLRTIFSKYTSDIYRTGGDEFVVFFVDDKNELQSLLQSIEDEEKKHQIKDVPLSLSYGAVKGIDYIDADIYKLITIAESNMYRYKDEFYKKNNLERRRDISIKF